MSGSGQISAEGFAALEAELNELETEGRRAIAERIRIAREFGDLSENAEYHDAKNAQAHLETKILRLRDQRDKAVVVTPDSGGQVDVAALGVRVHVEAEGREHEYELVGAPQSDPAAGKISIDSPLGVALAGARVGDKVDFVAPRGKRLLRVIALG